jgi:predicted ArsR family transcriptional regulator
VKETLGPEARSIGALADDLRRRMYVFIRANGAPVSREEAGEEVGISSKLAAFHLDKLVEHGLLKAHYARRPGRGGPGAGRSSKLYEPSGAALAVSIPERAYDLVGSMLVEALSSRSPKESAIDAARRVGLETGRDLGTAGRGRVATSAGRQARAAEDLLAALGFEPRPEEDGIVLANCPFHSLAQQNAELVCGLNEAFISGVLQGLRADGWRAKFAPSPGRCCVVLEEAKKAS